MLLREHSIPMMVLNAYQSATHAERSEDVFASVATALLRAGVRSVVAMAYSLFVSGRRVFLPAFYRRLFESRSGSARVSRSRADPRRAIRRSGERRLHSPAHHTLAPVNVLERLAPCACLRIAGAMKS